jgi:hypothetical protein
MTHEFLLHLHRSPGLIKQGPERVAKRMPADPSYTATNACGRDTALLYPPPK